MHNHQLYTLTQENYRLPFAVDFRGSVITIRADNIPMLCWPDGRWCLEANLYIMELYERGLSRKNDGGSLKTYAANISHLLRYCFLNYTDFIDLTDSQFTLFIRGLQVERKNKKPEIKVRDANTIINIGRNCLDFLGCVGRFHDQSDFVGKKGRIKAEQKEFQIKFVRRSSGRNTLVRKYWHHNVFPMPDSKVKVLPINTINIKKLREAVSQISNSIFLKRRRQIMLMMLEVTGGRRGEIANLTVNSVMSAKAMTEPVLELITLKRRASHTRKIPIPRPDLDMLISFIEKQRYQIVRKTVGTRNDHGYVFVSETSGNPIKSQTISQEMYALAKATGIDEKAHAHMFRHRFITKLFVALIEQHTVENVDDFRRALLDTESMKQKIQQWTGHTSTASLEIYINLAFEEVANFKKSYDAVTLARVIDSMRNQVAILRDDINSGMTQIEAMIKFEQLLDSFETELN